MSLGKVTLGGREYEINDVLDRDDGNPNGLEVRLALTPVLGKYDREVYRADVAESLTEFNIGSMQKGAADTVLGRYETSWLVSEVDNMEPGTAIVIIRREGSV